MLRWLGFGGESDGADGRASGTTTSPLHTTATSGGAGSGSVKGAGVAPGPAAPAVDAATVLQGGCPVGYGRTGGAASEPAATAADDGGAGGSTTFNPSNQMMVEEKQRPSPGQKTPLPTERRTSSIPKSEFTPGHQEAGQ